MAKLSPIFNEQVMDANGVPASGWKVNTYTAGSSARQTTYTDAAGFVAQTNPIILQADGRASSPIWLTEGQFYKFVLTDENDVVQYTADNIAGVNDTAVSASQWQSSGVSPAYISASSFSLLGDQTSEFHVGRQLQFTVTAGTVYGVIAASAFTSLTTVTVVMDSGSLDSGLSAVNLSILRADHPAMPSPTTRDIILAAGKKVIFEGTTDDAFELTLDPGDPTADRTLTAPDRSGIMALSDAMPVGTVIHSISSTAPTGFLKANGQTIGSASSGASGLASADAAALFAVIWASTSNTDFPILTSTGGASTRGASSSADFAANKRLPMPDLRGEFVRGLDDGKGTDATRTMGSSQLDAFQGHEHLAFNAGAGSVAGGGAIGQIGDSQLISNKPGYGTARYAAETRPRNVALMPYIRYL